MEVVVVQLVDEAPQGPILDVDAHGRRLVQLADDRITLNLERVNALLAAEGGTPLVELPDGTVELDSAGEHRYRRVEADRWRPGVDVYERI